MRAWPLLLCSLAACGSLDPLISRAEDAVKHELRDPDSAEFRNVRRCSRANVEAVEGEVNAKTDRGGYEGFVPFMFADNQVAFLARDDGIGQYAAFDNDKWERLRRICWSDDQLRQIQSDQANLTGMIDTNMTLPAPGPAIHAPAPAADDGFDGDLEGEGDIEAAPSPPPHTQPTSNSQAPAPKEQNGAVVANTE